MLFSGPGETPNKNKSVWISLWCENNGFWSTGLLKQTNILVFPQLLKMTVKMKWSGFYTGADARCSFLIEYYVIMQIDN